MLDLSEVGLLLLVELGLAVGNLLELALELGNLVLCKKDEKRCSGERGK